MEKAINMIEYLEQEMVDIVAEFEEIELKTENTAEALKERLKHFHSNSKMMKPSEKDFVYKKIGLDKNKFLKDTHKKLKEMCKSMKRRVYEELLIVKMELENDNACEKRQLEISPPTNSISDEKIALEKVFSVQETGNKKELPGHSSSITSTISNSSAKERFLVALSQLIANFQQLLKLGRRIRNKLFNASLKESYGAINSGQHLNKERTFRSTKIHCVDTAHSNNDYSVMVPSEPKKARTSIVVEPVAEQSPLLEDSSAMENDQVSYGCMIACHKKDCPFKWFHFDCIGLTQAPKGNWFCPQCSASMKH